MERSKLDRARRFVFSDIDLELTKLPSTDDIAKKLDLQAVKQSVMNIVNTNRGEKPFQPDFGCNLRKFLFEPFSPYVKAAAEDTIRLSLEAFEPRVILQDVTVSDDPDNNALRVTVEYTIRSPESSSDTASFLVERLR